MFVRNDGKVFYFCNSKCQNNWRLHREGKSTRWTHTFRKEIAGKKAATKEGRRPEDGRRQESPSVKASPSGGNQKAEKTVERTS
jgi:ribosomal protein L24E